MDTKNLVAVAAFALVLAACGGGGGSGTAQQPIVDTSPIVVATGGTPLSLSSDQIKAEIAQQLNQADTFLATDIFFVGG